MDELILIKPSIEYSEQIIAYRKEFLENNESMDGTSSLRKFEAPKDWLEWIKNNEHRETCAPGWVPSHQFISIRKSDHKLIGMIDIRLTLNDYLLNYAGHIGYSVRKSERGKNYAKMQLKLALLEIKKYGVHKVLITCDKNNITSQKVILSVNGCIENEVYDESDQTMTQRYWVENL